VVKQTPSCAMAAQGTHLMEGRTEQQITSGRGGRILAVSGGRTRERRAYLSDTIVPHLTGGIARNRIVYVTPLQDDAVVGPGTTIRT
jgi:hypothetical protein